MDEETPEGDKGGKRAADAEAEVRREEAEAVLAAGPGAGNRSGALAFLALLLVVAAVVHFHLAERGSGSYLNRLDSELINHAELSVAAMQDENRMAVVPSWPLRLYDTLRRDIAVYAVMAAAAAYVWSMAARARARRDAFLVYDRLNAELGELRRRLDAAERRLPPDDA